MRILNKLISFIYRREYTGKRDLLGRMLFVGDYVLWFGDRDHQIPYVIDRHPIKGSGVSYIKRRGGGFTGLGIWTATDKRFPTIKVDENGY